MLVACCFKSQSCMKWLAKHDSFFRGGAKSNIFKIISISGWVFKNSKYLRIDIVRDSAMFIGFRVSGFDKDSQVWQIPRFKPLKRFFTIDKVSFGFNSDWESCISWWTFWASKSNLLGKRECWTFKKIKVKLSWLPTPSSTFNHEIITFWSLDDLLLIMAT